MNNANDKQKIDWKPALDIFGQVSTWVIVPIILALIAGKALDKHFGTDPWIFLSLTGIAFLFSSYGIVRVIGKYMKTLEKEIKDNKNERTNNTN